MSLNKIAWHLYSSSFATRNREFTLLVLFSFFQLFQHITFPQNWVLWSRLLYWRFIYIWDIVSSLRHNLHSRNNFEIMNMLGHLLHARNPQKQWINPVPGKLLKRWANSQTQTNKRQKPINKQVGMSNFLKISFPRTRIMLDYLLQAKNKKGISSILWKLLKGWANG